MIKIIMIFLPAILPNFTNKEWNNIYEKKPRYYEYVNNVNKEFVYKLLLPIGGG